ncbi:hypothetical protein CAOG_05339 [Capsaspora owczarzaki ATCC 30864]|uniref:tRNAHis guanylyltransferase catalytic domain-containing protein n=1 Tax=Capsaspora owczarzaki (strain ATCC 30864) TaxID=595528 RepID=A0A0D2WRU9_CAPO3|nr:hypothetical protein CAOG_05339 [Capsaspora owczarzaki ATCC 30864]KJE94750.1 hypothetical protein CAOG_005339 [Capsaspora owczarzaki ATCC 30864]|eukprot:XP_004347024.2 hypothetical protein CAOG_05339 [Capsaspora owczarzaki ATCC 30864]
MEQQHAEQAAHAEAHPAAATMNTLNAAHSTMPDPRPQHASDSHAEESHSDTARNGGGNQRHPHNRGRGGGHRRGNGNGSAHAGRGRGGRGGGRGADHRGQKRRHEDDNDGGDRAARASASASANGDSSEDEAGAGDDVSRKRLRMERRDPTGIRMKAYEEVYTLTTLDPKKAFIIRLDGHTFGTFQRGFKKPYDTRFADSMALTCVDLVKEFNAVFGYAQTDEISLVFLPINPDVAGSELQHAGKVLKLATLAASFCSVRFNFHLNRQEFDPQTEEKVYERVRAHMAHFDGRVFSVPSFAEAVENVLWRAKFDCYRNSVSALAHHYLGNRLSFGLSTKQKLSKLMQMDVDWREMPNKFKFGTFAKKEQYPKECEDPRTHEKLTVMRTTVSSRSFDIDMIAKPRLVSLLFARTWNDFDAHVVPSEPFAELAQAADAASSVSGTASSELTAPPAVDAQLQPES